MTHAIIVPAGAPAVSLNGSLSAMGSERWLKALRIVDLSTDRGRTVKIGGKQLAVFQASTGVCHAIDNRCPHEGYPLATGPVKDGVLSCEWHNWKFRLRDGKCILGGEDVRSYPVEIRGTDVWVDVADNELGELSPVFYASLDQALDEAAWEQAGRTIERLLAAGEDPYDIIAFASKRCAQREPYGFGHGLAAAADWQKQLQRYPGEQGVILLEALHGLSEPVLRRPPRPGAEPEPVSPQADVGALLVNRIENEDALGAEALLRGVLQDTDPETGTDPSTVFGWLEQAATEHFLGYGHGHIYVIKAEELLGGIGWRHAEPILGGLVVAITRFTREDRLPYMRAYATCMEHHLPRLEHWEASTPAGDAGWNPEPLISAVLDGTVQEALTAVATSLDERVTPHRIALALGYAGSQRLFRFNESIERDDDISEGYLSVTHAMTHADAVRETLLRRTPTRHTLRGLFQSARFIQHLAPLDETPHRHASTPPEDPVNALLGSVTKDARVLPIFVAHHIKVAYAATRLDQAMGTDDSFQHVYPHRLPLTAATRFVQAQQAERRIARMARRAHQFVAGGKRQRSLLGY